MSKCFLNDDFLLDSESAKALYHGYAKDMPIFDFHCHLSPQDICQDKVFVDLAEIWLGGDHYKWRLMREYGIDEHYISGEASGYEKFEKYAEIMPYCIGNPVYVWTHLELKRYFGIDNILSPKTVKDIWIKSNERLKELSVRKLITSSKVKVLCTTDDPIDNLQSHIDISSSKYDTAVLPSFRPDKALNIHLDTFVDYVQQLSKVVYKSINTLDDLLLALSSRLDFFDSHGCVCSDHALDTVPQINLDKSKAAMVFDSAIRGKLDVSQADIYRSFVLVWLGQEYHKRKWVQQYHIGALRNNSLYAIKHYGADTGYDAINDQTFAPQLAQLLDSQASTSQLPKTILYCLNPRDNEILASIKNCFQQAGTVAKVQFGSAWWFNDQRDGMDRQIEALAQFGMLSKFVGMLTDSRSFLSYPRHEYFRRILCRKLGGYVESGEYPAQDLEIVGRIVQDICYYNAVDYFKKD